MIFPNEQGLPVEEKGETADMQRKREWIISELDEIFGMYGNPTPRNSVEVEAHLYNVSKTKPGEEFHVLYTTLARRMLRAILNMAISDGQERHDMSVMVTNHGQALPSPRRVDYGFFRLPPNGAFITLPQTRVAKRKRFGSGDAQASTSRNAEGVEVVRRGAGLENGRTNITSTSADRTYEATMVFVVPEGYRLKNVDVTLEKIPA